MSPSDRAIAWLKKVPGAISGQGGHDHTFHVACELVHGFGLGANEALGCLRDWNATCQPPWSPRELSHKVESVSSVSHDKPAGWRLTDSNSYTAPVTKVVLRKPDVPVPQRSGGLPDPLPDATSALLRAAFEEGEGISICEAHLNDEGRSIPSGQGLVLTREEWLARLESRGGDPNRIWQPEGAAGAFIRVNPMALGGSSDADVTSYRHALLEFDTTSLDEQWRIIEESGAPCTAVVYSGGKSVHAWVRVDAKDRVEYGVRVKELLDHFQQYKPDEKNKNPSRFARLAGMRRADKVQHLLAVNVGASSWSAWRASQSDTGTRTLTVADLLKIDPTSDPNSMIGRRWLCKGHSCLVVGPSGVGKSTLTMQVAVSWAIGIAPFGIAPVRPLKQLIIQAENDDGDLAEQLQATIKANPKWATPQAAKMLNDGLVFVRDTVHTGIEFVQRLQTLIDQHRPDVVWIDPLLSYIGDDVGDQAVASRFLRNWLGPVLESTGVVLMVVHHVRKPRADDVGRTGVDLQYLAAGSSELVNWARAVIYLDGSSSPDRCCLRLLKRGSRAEAVDHSGERSSQVWIRHSHLGPVWETCDPPDDDDGGQDRRPKVKPKRKPKASDDQLLGLFLEWVDWQVALQRMQDAFRMTQTEASQAFGDLRKRGLIVEDRTRTPTHYRIST